ncbi:ATPase, T2SS/T4P/T4SS family, partial [Francisella philomiragia]
MTSEESKIVSLFDSQVLELFFCDTVQNISLNPNGSIFIEDAEKGKYKLKNYKGSLTPLINFLADLNGLVINEKKPKLETSFLGMRITANIPPMTANPSLTIRKPNYKIWDLKEYIDEDSPNYYDYIIENFIYADTPKNMIVVGKTGSAKTSLVKSIIKEMVERIQNRDRIVSIEDTPELVIDVEDLVQLFTTESISISDCLKSSLRLTPERIFVGEVRDAAVIEMLNCWNTGHHGGISTMHTNGCEETIQRIISLGSKLMDLEKLYILMATTIGTIVSIRKVNGKPKIVDIKEVVGYDR